MVNLKTILYRLRLVVFADCELATTVIANAFLFRWVGRYMECRTALGAGSAACKSILNSLVVNFDRQSYIDLDTLFLKLFCLIYRP